MMSETQFWDLIAEAKSAVGNTKDILNWLEQALLELPPKEIIDFGAWLATFLDRSNDEKLWSAGSIVAGGLGDDGFVYFQCWLIAQGRIVFERALTNPDSLADIEYPAFEFFGPDVNLEKLLYVSTNALNKKLGGSVNARDEWYSNYQPPSGNHPKRTERKNIGFLTRGDSTRATAFSKLTKRFGRQNKS